MLTLDPKKRPSAADLLEHTWLNDHADKPTGSIAKDLSSKLKTFTGVPKLKKIALTLIAQQLNDKDIEDLKAAFTLLDKNKDGSLTIVELNQGMKDSGIKLPDDFQKTFEGFDTDGSGSIDYTEFIAATLTNKQYMKKEVVWSAFRTFDKDGDGQITKAELASMLTTGDETLSDLLKEQVEQMMVECDLDGDGSISWEEFNKMMEMPAEERSL